MTTSFSDYVAQQDARNDIHLKIREWTLMLCDVLEDNFKRRYLKADPYKFSIQSGRKYYKILKTDSGEGASVHAFVDKKTGEVYKPASWKAPAKHVRFDLRLIKDREWLFENADCFGGYLYM